MNKWCKVISILNLILKHLKETNVTVQQQHPLRFKPNLWEKDSQYHTFSNFCRKLHPLLYLY